MRRLPGRSQREAGSVVTAPVTVPVARDHGQELDHLFCDRHTGNVALCGADISGHELHGDSAVLTEPCVVCLDLEDKPCRRCGR